MKKENNAISDTDLNNYILGLMSLPVKATSLTRITQSCNYHFGKKFKLKEIREMVTWMESVGELKTRKVGNSTVAYIGIK